MFPTPGAHNSSCWSKVWKSITTSKIVTSWASLSSSCSAPLPTGLVVERTVGSLTHPAPLPSVADLDQVVRQSLDRLYCVAGLCALAVVADQDSLLSLDDGDAGAALLIRVSSAISHTFVVRDCASGRTCRA